MPELEQETAYRPVMRRLPPKPPPVRDVYADLTAWEYWNGHAWKLIPGTALQAGAFSAENSGGQRSRRLEARFSWPEDAACCTVQGMNAFWLRWRLQSCEGAGWLPVCYHVPEVTDLRITAGLSGAEAAVERRSGLEAAFSRLSGKQRILFPALEADHAGWWLGFDRPPDGDTVKIYLSLDGRTSGRPLSAWEALPSGGEAPLLLQDGTEGLAHSGLLTLGGVSGKPAFRFGAACWWICLRDASNAMGPAGRHPALLRLSCGAAVLRGVSGDACFAGDSFLPLQGGPVSAVALTASFGGVAAETERERILRAERERHHQGRIVSGLDADQLLRGTLRDVVRTRCIRSGDRVQVGVLLRDAAHHGEAFQLRKDQIVCLLERASVLPALGVSIQAREPSFYPIHVAAWISPPPESGFTETSRRLKEALERFLNPAEGHFSGTGWKMGELPTADQIRACLHAAVPGVRLMELITAASVPGGGEREIALIRDPFALPTGGSFMIRELKGGGAD